MILYKYILKAHFLPFTFSVITLICIFILQFMMKFADRLVGKGLDTWVVMKLISFNLAWMVVLVVPMATLVAALMAFGNLSQNNEITILKSSGVSLFRLMLAPFVASVVLGYLLFLFNNDVLPDANHQAKVLMMDISRQKPTLSLDPGYFSQDVTNYAILARGIDQNSNQLTSVTIYDYSNPQKVNVVTAERGRIYYSADNAKLMMDLSNGEIHETDAAQTGMYRKLIFEQHRIAMPADQFTFQQTGPGAPRGERELSVQSMQAIVDSITLLRDNFLEKSSNDIYSYMNLDTSVIIPVPAFSPSDTASVQVYARAIEQVRTTKNVIASNLKRVEYMQGEINKYDVEIYKKYALPAACVIFILIGAPLGVMVKKGGFGTAASISLFFFLIYWAFLIGGEKLAERDFFSPFLGMWAANIVLGIAGIIITYKVLKESTTISFAWSRKFLPKQWQEIEEIDEHIADELT
jgi:lipopolysaccharide export system permease protein